MDDDVKQALEQYKKSKRVLRADKEKLLAVLPEEVSSEFHWNGWRAKDRFPEYASVIEELLK